MMRLYHQKSVGLLLAADLFIAALFWGCGDVSVEQVPAPEMQNEAVQATTGSIRGTITPSVNGTSINAFRDEDWVAFTTNNEEGDFEFQDLSEGTYALEVSAPFHFVDISNRKLEVIVGQVTEAKPVFLRAWKDAAKLFGKVIDANTKQPLPEVEIDVVCVTRICNALSVTSDAHGAF